MHFCATKIESFLGRSQGDFFHHDMEDLIAVVDARAELNNEIAQAPTDVRDFIAEQIGHWLRDPEFIESVAGNLAGDAASQARLPILLARLRQISGLLTIEPGVPPSPSSQALPLRASGGPMSATPVPLPSQILLRSSNLKAAAYDSATQALTIEFRSGTTYGYSGVPQAVYEGLVRAPSHGKYFLQWIKDRYRRLK